MTVNSARVPIRLVLFDAFDTLVRPTTAPHLQYAEAARQHGLEVDDQDVKSAFRQAFKETSRQHPNYGLETSIASPDQWWDLVIRRTFSPEFHPRLYKVDSSSSRARIEDRIAPLSQSLVERFGTSKAYTLFDDVIPTLQSLSSSPDTNAANTHLRLGLATNSDSRILSVLKGFGLDQFLDLTPSDNPGLGPTLSYFEKVAKPDPRFFAAAIGRNPPSSRAGSDETKTTEPLRPENVLYVGDQLYEDFWGATDAGLQALWLHRPSNSESNQPYQDATANHNNSEDQEFARQRTIQSLTEVVDYVRRSNRL
ncbi:HAD-like protein [Testicularia cyperi]|uniref:HAD-like protein n=1 Tax=Testicularia cyperi TaxID=1882483 RepID=A0A317XJF8_9BASI|nr:HAD-like protein [Testicularia cyperi]